MRIHEYLVGRRVDSTLLYQGECTFDLVMGDWAEADRWVETYDIFVLQKLFGPQAIRLANKIQEKGKLVVDLLSDLDLSDRILPLANQVVTPSSYLRDVLTYYVGEKVRFIPLAYEDAGDVYKKDYTQVGPKPMAVCFVHANENFEAAINIRSLLEKNGWNLTIISNHEQADLPWSDDTAWKDIVSHDIVVLPTTFSEYAKCKSACRMVQSMSLGMPLICNPIPDYVRLLRPPLNGFIAYTEADWKQQLDALTHVEIRERAGRRARMDALSIFNIDRIGSIWLSLFEEMFKYAKPKEDVC
jgi:hypothetical protein